MRGGNLEATKGGLRLLKRLAVETRKLRLPPETGKASATQQVLPISVVRGTRPYLEAITNQFNGAYENGWYDACAVMMRRLIETLIIEVFEGQGMPNKIQTESGDFLQLNRLIDRVCTERRWNLSRATKRALSDVKNVGGNSAHSRRFTAHRVDIDNLKADFRVAVQELVSLSELP